MQNPKERQEYKLDGARDIIVVVVVVVVVVQSAFHEKVPAVGWRLWCGSGVKFSGKWTKGLLLVENSMTHQRVTLLHTD
jgi:hypothetical protein